MFPRSEDVSERYAARAKAQRGSSKVALVRTMTTSGWGRVPTKTQRHRGPRADNGDERVGPGADNGNGHNDVEANAGRQRTKMQPYDDPGDVGAGCSPDNGDERVGPRADKGDGWLGSGAEKGDEQMGPHANKGDGQIELSANKDALTSGAWDGCEAGTCLRAAVRGPMAARWSTACIMPSDGIFATALAGVSRFTHGSPRQTFVVRCFNA
ncbi:hypothetical protein B0H14DRAFT_3642251 [Mycena olivaceomarginata]|nr:hypothetical protein B0H14DRAFT_3642251 [Mycena olivaceomarginata]